MSCVCGHPDSAHDSRGCCRAPGCTCDAFEPMPQVWPEHHGGGARLIAEPTVGIGGPDHGENT
jgi:hypothetical protein